MAASLLEAKSTVTETEPPSNPHNPRRYRFSLGKAGVSIMRPCSQAGPPVERSRARRRGSPTESRPGCFSYSPEKRQTEQVHINDKHHGFERPKAIRPSACRIS